MRDPDVSGKAGNAGPVPVQSPMQDPDVSIGRLKRRADFLRAAKGRRWHGKGFSLQAGPVVADAEAPAVARVGFTVTKKVGGSVVRNRARRRLREALRLSPGLPVRAGHDYVVIARIEAVRLPFTTLQTDLNRAIRSVHAEARPHDASKRPNQAVPPGGSKRTRPSR